MIEEPIDKDVYEVYSLSYAIVSLSAHKAI